MDIWSSFYSSQFQGIWVELLLGDFTTVLFFGTWSSVERLHIRGITDPHLSIYIALPTVKTSLWPDLL